MVLISNDNALNIKNNHILKCLEKKKNTFNMFVIPLTTPLKETYVIDDISVNVLKDNIVNLTDNDIKTIFHSK